jgi:hypothetical protein
LDERRSNGFGTGKKLALKDELVGLLAIGAPSTVITRDAQPVQFLAEQVVDIISECFHGAGAFQNAYH